MNGFIFINRLQHRLWSTSTSLLLVRPAGTTVSIPEEKRCPGELREVTEENLIDCGAFEDAAHYVPTYRSMLEKGDLVLFGYLNRRCVFRFCIQLHGQISFDGCAVRFLNNTENYIHYVYCDQEFRGHHFHLAALAYTAATHHSQHSYAVVKEDNIPSLKSFYQAGYKPYSLLTVKNRFFHRTLTQHELTEEMKNRFTWDILHHNSTIHEKL